MLSSEAAGRAHPASALYPGEKLVANTSGDSLRNGQFQFQVESDQVTLWQNAVTYGPHFQSTWTTGVWFDGDRAGHNYKGHSVLRMQRDGDLVLRTRSHKLIWRTGTRGRRNHLQLRRNGALVVVNSRDRVLWSAHTHPVLLGDGNTLPPGGVLNSRWGDWQGGPSSRLVMQRSGNVVVQCNGRTVWSTHTHRAGSALSLLRSGNLVVRGPRGTVLWRSHSRARTPYSVLNGPGLQIENDNDHVVWAGHQRRSPCNPYASRPGVK